MSPTAFDDALARRHRAAIRAILTVKEQHCDPHLPQEAAEKLRRTVMAEINECLSLAVALLESSADESREFNELWLQRIEEIHTAVVGGET